MARAAGLQIVRKTSAGLIAVGSLAALALKPQITLASDEMALTGTAADLLTRFRQRFGDANADILAAGEDRIVRRFSGRAGPFPYRTVELITFSDSAITFDHLSGPFAHCHETFDLQPTDDPGATLLVHSGTFQLRGGLWAAPLAVGPVKKAFEAHVHEHLRSMAADLAP